MAPRNPPAPDITDIPAQLGNPDMQWVIIQRPAGNTEVGQYLGFNQVSGIYPFDAPIQLPADMVEYYRSMKTAEAYPDAEGNPVISYVNMFHIIDAAAPAAS